MAVYRYMYIIELFLLLVNTNNECTSWVHMLRLERLFASHSSIEPSRPQ